MSANKIGELFSLTTFGESHSVCLGGVIEGMPSAFRIDDSFIQSELSRRKPNNLDFATQRQEQDTVEFVSGVENGLTLGSPIAFLIHNVDVRKQDYDYLQGLFRPSHADYTYYKKYGLKLQSGAGRASGRETTVRVVGGAVAKLFLNTFGITITAKIDKIGHYDYATQRQEIKRELSTLRERGETLGGVVACSVQGLFCGLGEPIFDKINAQIAKAQLSIPSACAFEMGDGFSGCERYGSEQIDHWQENFKTKTNHCGGVQAGLTNGMPMDFRVGFKPIASLQREIPFIDTLGNIKDVELTGRMDCCIVPRVLVVVEAMAALSIADFVLRDKLNK
jgi:chorismate synthase